MTTIRNDASPGFTVFAIPDVADDSYADATEMQAGRLTGGLSRRRRVTASPVSLFPSMPTVFGTEQAPSPHEFDRVIHLSRVASLNNRFVGLDPRTGRVWWTGLGVDMPDLVNAPAWQNEAGDTVAVPASRSRNAYPYASVVTLDGSQFGVLPPRRQRYLAGDLAVSVWLKPAANLAVAADDDVQSVLSSKTALADADGFDLAVNPQTDKVILTGEWASNIKGDARSTAPATWSDGNWHHVVAVFNGQGGKIFVDGVDATGGLLMGAIRPKRGPLAIGRLAGTVGAAGQYYYGGISDLRVYNGTVVASRANQIFEATRGRYGV